MTNRYLNNLETVRKIAKVFGLKLRSFEPNWTFVESNDNTLTFIYDPPDELEHISQSMLSSYVIPDDFMGKVALLMHLPWEFDTPTEHLEQLLSEYTGSLNNIGKNKPELPDIPECKEELERIQKMTDDLDRQVKDGTQKKIDNINDILKIRKELENYHA